MKANPCITLYLILCIICNPTYGATLEVDTAVSTANQATLDEAPNGVPVVNIVAPTAQGLSHNKFKNYNVNEQGLILNNSKVVTNTQLAGYISYNKNLTGNNASLILNEVTGTNRSLLKGYTEVAGVAANVIVANPNGITVNGGGFINTPNAILTTGEPLFDENLLQGFNVSRGDILIEGGGLNVENIDQVDLYAKVVQLNAKIYAQKLNIVAGDNKVSLDGSIGGKETSGSGVAIDSSQLGGIYANTITLVSSDKGVGVNLPPEVFAEDSLTISADGDIVLSNAMSNDTISVTSKSQNVESTADVAAKEIAIEAKQKVFVKASSTLEANDKLHLTADTLDNNGTLSSVSTNGQAVLQVESEVNNDGDIKADNVEITTAKLKNQKHIYSNNDITLVTTELENSGLIQANDGIKVETTTLDNRSEGGISAQNKTAIIAQHIFNDGIIAGKSVEITAGIDGNGALGSEVNNNGDIKANNIEITTAKLKNQKEIYSNNDIKLVTTELENSGLIQANDDIKAETTALNNRSEGVISAQDKTAITAQHISNDGIIAGKSVEITANDIVNKGALYSRNDLTVTANVLTNHEMIRSNNEINLLIANTLKNEKSGVIYSDGEMTIAANQDKDKINTVTNHGLIQAHDTINITAKQLDNISDNPVYRDQTSTSSKTISLGGSNNFDRVTTTVQTQVVTVTSDPSYILADGNINIDVETLNNFYSLIAADGDIHLLANRANNVGKIVITNKTTVTKRYRDEKYCSISGASGACFKHKHRAAYRGTFTTTSTSKLPVVNYGIQAKRSITGNVVSLNNSSSVGGALSEADIAQKSAQVTTLETNSASLQEVQESLDESNETASRALGEVPDMNELISGIQTDEDLSAFKDGLATLEQSLQDTINLDKANIETLESVLAFSKTLEQTAAITSNIASLESTLASLKDNLVKNEANMEAFRTAQTTIFTPPEDEEAISTQTNQTTDTTEVVDTLPDSSITDDPSASPTDDTTNLDDATTPQDELLRQKDELLKQKDTLIQIDSDVRTIIADNGTILETLNASGSVESLVGKFEAISNTLNGEIKTILDAKSSNTKTSISVNDGLYQTNSNYNLKSTSDVTYGLDTDSKDFVAELELPKNKFGLFVRNTSPEHPYLVESNPLYTNYQTFIGSDYLMSRLTYRPENTVQRLGDDMYETTLVRDSVIKLSGKRRIDDYASDTEQYQALMNNALSLEEDLNLKLGITLTKEQIANLTKDIVWLEERVIDGNTVLVPVVYLASLDVDKMTDGSAISAGENIDLVSRGNVTNQGVIHADGDVHLEANRISNQGGNITADANITLDSETSITNTSGKIAAGNDLAMNAQDITIATAQDSKHYQQKGGSQTITVNGIQSLVQAGNHLTLNGQDNINIEGSKLTASNLLLVSPDGQIQVNSIASNSDYQFNFANGYSKGNSVVNLASTLEADNISANAKTLTLTSSTLNANDSISLEGVDKIEVLASNDRDYSETQITSSSGFMGSKTERDMNYKESVVGSELNAKNITLTSTEGGVKLEAAKLKAEENIVIDAKKDIEVLAKQYREGSLHYSKTSSWGGLKQSASMNRTDALNVKEASLETEALNVILKSGNDIKVIGSNIDAASDVQLQAANDVLVSAAQEYSKEENWSKSSSFNVLSFVGSLATLGLADFGPVYEMNDKIKESADTTAKSASIVSGGNIDIDAGSAKVVGSNLQAQGDVNAQTDVGSIEILAAQEESTTHTEEKKIDVSISRVFDSVKNVFSGLGNDTQLKLTIAQANYDDVGQTDQTVTHKGTNVISEGGNVDLNSTENITIEGSNVRADSGDINLSAGQNVNIVSATNTQTTVRDETHASASVSATVQNEYVEAANAYRELADATKQLRQTKSKYKQYKGNVSELESKLTMLKQAYANKTPGIDKDDITDIQALIDDIKDDEQYYLAAIAAATVNLASKTTLAYQQTASAASSSGTLGFSMGLSLDVDGSKTKTNRTATQSVGSSLAANNIHVTTKTDNHNQTTIQGSDVQARNALSIETGELNVLASVDTSEQSQKSQDINGNVSMTVYGAASGPQVGFGYGQNESRSSSQTLHNTQLTAGNITTNTAADTNIKGGNLDAGELLSMVVGGDLNIESQIDRSSSHSNGFNVSGGFGLGNDSDYQSDDKSEQKGLNQTVGVRTGNGKLASVKGGYGANAGRTRQKTTVLSSATGKEVNVTVANNTNLKGALLAAGEQQADGHFADNGNLHLKTDTLTYTNTSNSLYSSDNSFNVSTSVGFSEGNDEQGNPETKASLGTVNSSFSMGRTNEKSKTLATLGQGNIEVTDKEHSDDPERLNRDTDKVEKGLYAVSQHAGAEMALDTRIVTEEGRKEIAEDITTTGEAAGDIAFKLGAKEMSKALYDIDDPVIAEALKNNANTALDEMIERGIEPALAKQLLSTPELYQAASDILYAYDKANSVTEYKDSVSTSKSGALELILRGPSAEEKVLLGLNDAKEYIDTLPTAQAQAAVVAIQMLTGGVVKTAVDFAKDLAVDTVFGDYLNQVKHDVAAKIAAHADNTTVSTHEFLLAYDEESETKSNSTKSQNGAEFALDVLGVGASSAIGAIGIKKGSHPYESDVKIKSEVDGTGTVLAGDVAKGTSFQKAVGQLSEVGQQNVRTLQSWAKSKGWVRKPGDGPEVWGVKDANGNFSWRLKVKPEASNRQGLQAGSNQPRFDARLDTNGTYVNPFTGQTGTKAVGTHIPLE